MVVGDRKKGDSSTESSDEVDRKDSASSKSKKKSPFANLKANIMKDMHMTEDSGMQNGDDKTKQVRIAEDLPVPENINSANKNDNDKSENRPDSKRNKKSPFANLKANIMKDMHMEDSSGVTDLMQSEIQPVQKKKSPFSDLKENILNEMNGEPDTSSKSLRPKKIDMAYLKATIQDTLKQKSSEETTTVSQYADRVHTNIEGFDEIIEGGFVRNSANLICGGPGSGKSIFAMQCLVNGIDKDNENGIYITFEEEPMDLVNDMKRFEWDIERKIANKKLAILYYSPEQVDRVIQLGGGPVREVIESIQAKRIVIDSVTAFTLLYKTENDQRRALMNLFKTLKKWGCTSFLISEQTLTMDSHVSTVEEFQSEGVIMLYHAKRGEVRERSLEVFKMRGTNHSTKIIPMKISSDGITVYPDETVY